MTDSLLRRKSIIPDNSGEHGLARTLGCAYLNSQEHVEPSPLDGIHLDAEAHAVLGRAIAAAVRSLA